MKHCAVGYGFAMAATPDDPVDYIAVTRDTYAQLGYSEYRWADNRDAPAPFTEPKRPLAESTVVLIASGGVYAVGDVGFTHKDDVTFREIPTDTPSEQLRVTHFAYDETSAKDDVNAVFPIEALRAMDAGGEIGGFADVALTFMGGIYSQRRLHETLVPGVVERVKQLDADIALLVPV